jgi:Amidohydrolase
VPAGKFPFLFWIAWWLILIHPISLVQPVAAQDGVSIVDVHVHPARFIGRMTADGFIARALRTMKEYQIEKTIALPPPTPRGRIWRERWPEFIDAIKAHPNSFAFGAGPEQLNHLILTTSAGAVTMEMRSKFEAIAKRLIDSGVSVLGEFVAEHFSFGQHPHMSVAPDHPLLLLLADIAARHNVPVDLHMEAVPTDMPMPDLWPGRRYPPRTNNPTRLKANVSGFERLLAHNTNAKIVWAHAGWDNTGERTVALMRRLLAKHPNLYMSIKLHGPHPGLTTPFAFFGGIRTEWLDLFRDFPDRFVIGSDQFYDEEPGDHMDPMREFVNALPPELARKIARENAIRLYRLKE